MRTTEYQANAALHAAAQRLEWEGTHLDAWMQPAPQRQRGTAHKTDYVLLVLLVSVIGALSLGVL